MAGYSSQHQVNTGDVNCYNVSNSYNTVDVNTRREDEDHQILEWLSPLKPQQRHHDVRANRLDGVGNWLLRTKEFRRWSNREDGGAQAVLFCCGNPGVGKTYLASLVIDDLCDRLVGKDTAIAGLYCDFLAHEEQSGTNMLGAILKQLVARENIPNHVRQAFQKAKREFGGRRLRLPELVEMLKGTIESIPEVFICIDALDESSPRYLLELLGSLRDILGKSPRTRVFLTGRPHVQDEIVRSFAEAVVVPVSPSKGEIRDYLERRLDRDTEADAMDDDLRADIMKTIPETISEVFLLVSLSVEAVLAEITIYDRRKKLEEMTKGSSLGDAYKATLTRVKLQNATKSRIGMEVLMWVSHSERPLRTDELCHALAVETGSRDLNAQSVPSTKTLLGCCLGLVAVEVSSSTVRLVHFTLQEYLNQTPTLFCSPHAMIAEVCLTYLNFHSIMELSPDSSLTPSAACLLRYASHYWGTHVRREVNENIKPLMHSLLSVYDRHISSRLFLSHIRGESRLGLPGLGTLKGFTGLHCAAYLGLFEIMIDLLGMNKWDLNAVDWDGNTAIMRAARQGHGAVVKLLLEQDGIDPDKADLGGRTPLWWAAVIGHGGIVEVLFERNDVNPNPADIHGEPLLLWAVRERREDLVSGLLERANVNPNKPDHLGRTALSRAAELGNDGIVGVLLERVDANFEIPDHQGRTPLWWAAVAGQCDVTKLLLERIGINPDKPDSYGRTLLSHAAEHAKECVVKMLLEGEDVNPNTVDLYGRTPLTWAAASGGEGVVGMLLNHVDIKPDIPDNDGRTPLSWAVWNGNQGVVKILLEREDVSPDTRDLSGETLLSWASQSHHYAIAKHLLKRKYHDQSPGREDSPEILSPGQSEIPEPPSQRIRRHWLTGPRPRTRPSSTPWWQLANS